MQAHIGVCPWGCIGLGSMGVVDVCEYGAMGVHVSSPCNSDSEPPESGTHPSVDLSIYSSNIFYLSEVPTRVLGTERCPRKTRDLAATTHHVTALPKQVTKPRSLHSDLLSHLLHHLTLPRAVKALCLLS